MLKTKSSKRNLSISLFAWIGWFDKWLKLAWVETTIANDFFWWASQTFRRNFPETTHIQFDLYQLNNLDIISNFIEQQKNISSTEDHNHSWKNKFNNGIDIVTWWFPCQSFSMWWKRNGIKDDIDSVKWKDWRIRWRLYLEMIKIIEKQNPKMFIAENVSWLVSMDNWEVLNLIVSDFEKLWYNISYELLDMSNYWVPQKRKRIFIVWIRKDLNKKFVFPKSLYEQHLDLSKKYDLWYVLDSKKFEFNVLDWISDIQTYKEMEELTNNEREKFEYYKDLDISLMYSFLMKSKTINFRDAFQKKYEKDFFKEWENIKLNSVFREMNKYIENIYSLIWDSDSCAMDILEINEKIEFNLIRLINLELLIYWKFWKEDHFKSCLSKQLTHDTFRIKSNRKPNNEVFNVFDLIWKWEKSSKDSVQEAIIWLWYTDKHWNVKKYSFSWWYKRFHWENPWLTLTCWHGTELHPYLNRTMNVYELKRIQSFEDSFQILWSGTEQEVQLWNSITPLASYFIFKDINQYL